MLLPEGLGALRVALGVSVSPSFSTAAASDSTATLHTRSAMGTAQAHQRPGHARLRAAVLRLEGHHAGVVGQGLLVAARSPGAPRPPPPAWRGPPPAPACARCSSPRPPSPASAGAARPTAARRPARWTGTGAPDGPRRARRATSSRPPAFTVSSMRVLSSRRHGRALGFRVRRHQRVEALVRRLQRLEVLALRLEEQRRARVERLLVAGRHLQHARVRLQRAGAVAAQVQRVAAQHVHVQRGGQRTRARTRRRRRASPDFARACATDSMASSAWPGVKPQFAASGVALAALPSFLLGREEQLAQRPPPWPAPGPGRRARPRCGRSCSRACPATRRSRRSSPARAGLPTSRAASSAPRRRAAACSSPPRGGPTAAARPAPRGSPRASWGDRGAARRWRQRPCRRPWTERPGCRAESWGGREAGRWARPRAARSWPGRGTGS